MKRFLAIDIGASSGRHIVGYFEDGRLITDEVYRFKNGPVEQDGHLIWPIDKLFDEIIRGIRQAFLKYDGIASLAIDTWGVDYVLLRGDEVVYPCYAYRDARTKEPIEKVHEIIPFAELYARTGIQFQPFNTVYQLYADKLAGRLDGVTDFLLIPEYLTYKLTGIKTHEYTNATTGGTINAASGEYDREIIERLGLPKALFGEISQPGAVVGRLLPEIENAVGGQLDVVLCASHDTGSAVEGIPMKDDQLYLSSGTWSLLGIKADKPITTPRSLECNYTNEGGVGYVRYLKNIMGMWVVNNLKAEICPELPFEAIERAANESAFDGTVNVNDERFLAPKSMKAAFDSCFEKAPETVGNYFRCAFRSLALCYRDTVAELSELTGRQFTELYIVGGGAKNNCLNDMIKEECGVSVVALPIEATAIGNLLVQSKIYE